MHFQNPDHFSPANAIAVDTAIPNAVSPSVEQLHA
jgi:hypothetical protein